jgi:cysteinyl-tRNA synthetase
MPSFYNTLTRKVEEFTPLNDKKVTIYTCGPTVYSTPHIGNFVAYIRWDTLVRTLQDAGYEVNRVMNITDVGHLVSDGDEGEDKILKGALREGISMYEVAERYTKEFIDGMTALNWIEPTHVTKATDFIAEQIELVKTLEAKGFTYVINDGVYFDTSKFPRYADFARLDLEGMKAGARVDHNSEKRGIADFALWKFDTTGQRTEMVWDSPWGKGFPGWHLECSAMILAKLGKTIDIHTGGIDHIPVHHTNEIAQSEAANDAQLANFWIHGAHLLTEGTKISKSLGNVYYLSDVTDKGFCAMDFRMFVLQSNYRTETNFTWDNLHAAAQRLKRWQAVARLRHQTHDTLIDDEAKSSDEITLELLRASQDAKLALLDDLNTPEALKSIEEAFNLLENKGVADIHQRSLIEFIEWIDGVLGLRLIESTPDIHDDTKQLILERERAREAKDWARSDELRAEIEKGGVSIRDTAHGTIWY